MSRPAALPDGQVEICAWCGDPATQQALTGYAVDSTGAHPRWAWLCDECIRQSDQEREISRGS